jgi:hypothetical protein
MAATPGAYAAANLRIGGTAISLGQIARSLRQAKPQAAQSPLVISQDSSGKLQVCDATGGNCRHPQ